MILVKNAGIVVASMILAIILIMIVQFINLQLFPLPEWVDVNNPEHLAKVMATLPLTALFMVEASYVIGSYGAGFLIKRIAKKNIKVLVLIVGILLTLAGLVNLMSIPHPLWFAVLTTVTYIPLVYLGSKI